MVVYNFKNPFNVFFIEFMYIKYKGYHHEGINTELPANSVYWCFS